MRPFRVAGVIGMLCVALGVSPSVVAAQICPDGHFEGDIGGAAVRAFFDNSYPATQANQLLGTFIYTASWSGTDSTRALDGMVSEDCSIRFDEVDSHGRSTASWSIKFANGRFEGIRTDPSGARELIMLRPGMKVDCSGTGTWKTFQSNEWPITFSYPASWRLSEHDWGIGSEHEFGIELTCPDPDRLSRGGFPITLVRGTGEPANSRFVLADSGQWMIGDDRCLDAATTDLPLGCAFARTGRRFGMSVLQGAAGEHRLYRPGGGYVGQGPGILSYLFTFGSNWVALNSEDPPGWDVGDKPGPARFEGTGVTERLVRSIRPRAARSTRPSSTPR